MLDTESNLTKPNYNFSSFDAFSFITKIGLA